MEGFGQSADRARHGSARLPDFAHCAAIFRLDLRLRHSPAEVCRPTVAVFPIEVADTSGEAGNPQWPQRVAVVTGTLARELTASGRYRAVDLTSERDRLAGMAPIYRCDGCWRELAREVGADAAAITVVHKMSTLVSSMHVWLVDVATQKLIGRVRSRCAAIPRKHGDGRWGSCCAGAS